MERIDNKLVEYEKRGPDDLFMYFRDYAKFPYSTIKVEKLFRIEDDKRSLLRVFVDFTTESLPSYKMLSSTETPKGKVRFEQSVSIYSYSDVKKYLKFTDWLEKTDLEIFNLLNGMNFYQTEFPAPAGDGFAFWLDSKNKWPAWYLVGSNKEIKETSIRGAHQGPHSEETGIEIEENVFGYRRDAVEKLGPIFVLRFFQDLLRIDQNRIVKKENEESIYLSFEQGLASFFYINNSQPFVKYRLFDKKEQVIGEGSELLDINHLRDGISLNLFEGGESSEIASSSIYLELGGGVVDYSEGYYLRGFKIDVSTK